MQVCISTRDCRAAVGAAIAALIQKVASDKEAVTKTSLDNLLTGAIHNGLDVNEARRKEMTEMVDRDVEHMMKSHPGNELLQVLNNYVDMLAYHKGEFITIDDQDFSLIKAHLPAGEKSEEIAA